MNEGDIEELQPLLEERGAHRGSDEGGPAVEPEDGGVPPSGALEPDPTGLGALA